MNWNDTAPGSAAGGRVRGGSPLPASASARDNTGQGDVLAALGRQEVGRVRGRGRSDMARVLGRRDTGSLPYRRVGCRRLERREAERRQWAGTSWPRYGGPAPGVGLLVYPGVKQRS